jgi:hypothetical protein
MIAKTVIGGVAAFMRIVPERRADNRKATGRIGPGDLDGQKERQQHLHCHREESEKRAARPACLRQAIPPGAHCAASASSAP